jgi:DNA-binding transcriptional LysR family regulator
MDEGIEFDDILAFVATAEGGSVNGAAERLGLAQPIVTRRIQRLESSLGIDLLDRKVRPMALTAAGIQALAPCRAALHAVAALRAATGDTAPTGELRLGVAPALADLALTGSLASLRHRYPGVTLRVHTEWTPQLLHQLRAGVLDLAVAQLPLDAPPPAGLEARMLGVERLVLVAARQLDLATEVDLATLARLPWVLSPEGGGARVLLDAAFRRWGLPLHIAAELQDHTTQVVLVAQGVGIGLLPARVLARHPLAPQLQVIHLPGTDLALHIWLAHAQPSPRLAAPLALLTEALADAVAHGLDASVAHDRTPQC